MKYGMKDIAKKANVSLTTVSLVLNNKESRISTQKKQEIKRIAKEMNYQPNSAAVLLSKQISYNIGLIVPDITNPFFTELTQFINRQLRQNGYFTLFVDSGNSYLGEKQAIENMISRGVDGILLVPSSEFFSADQAEVETMFKNAGKPIILLNASTDMDISYVNFNNVEGAMMATQELIDHGHRNIAFIKGKDHLVNAQERYQGYKKGLEKNQLPFRKALVFEGDYSSNSGYQLAPQILKQSAITAILSSNDLMLFGLIKWSKEQGVDIFNRFSMVGFDNTPYTEIIEVPLTTIDQDAEKMSEDAIKMLLKKIKGKHDVTEKIIIQPRLIRRKSVKFI
ncbi:LacI family transcriptional regulator [Lentilactobacillus fungorum]|uniref:LacI family transcriptional regulator n=1 Tax=Lentilactobacillus fungorum TaxID=2201250 RepID=A0ABQ3W166_9LACO|nr:LacI family DNA-binding transcriptional regulator [Lentilactobacillus fungorum]GHP13909.1 LacI family transcriptional regulator [Lentilactobacillus fungorum]